VFSRGGGAVGPEFAPPSRRGSGSLTTKVESSRWGIPGGAMGRLSHDTTQHWCNRPRRTYFVSRSRLNCRPCGLSKVPPPFPFGCSRGPVPAGRRRTAPDTRGPPLNRRFPPERPLYRPLSQSIKDLPVRQDGPPPGGFFPIRFGKRIPNSGPAGTTLLVGEQAALPGRWQSAATHSASTFTK